MLLDADGPDRSAFERDFDVCVIGAGPAGITLARALAARGFEVALMEAGGLEWSPESQDVYAGENVGLDYHDLDAARLRYFGGTSGHWNGVCREFDAADLQSRPQNPLSGWPIGKGELDPYAAEAAEVLDLGPKSDFPDLPMPPGSAFRHVQFRRSPPTRLGEKYLDEITAAPRIFLALNANLIDLRLHDDLASVSGAVFRSYATDDPGFTVRARAYCLCAGGIENARLLLNFRSQTSAGLGNAHGLVGRFFSEHPSLFLGEVIFEGAVPKEDPHFVPTEAFLTEHGTLPLSLRLMPRPRRQLSLGAELAREVQCTLPFGERLAAAVAGGAGRCDTGGLGEYWRSRNQERYPWGRVAANSEQALNPDSRVTLTEARDAFGMQRARLHWALQKIDYRTVRDATLELARHVASNGIARMRIYDWLLAEQPTLPATNAALGNIGSWHHMCTTRMSDDPRTGVVDRDCRLYGTSNLFIGGSSVFASGSYVNPTYTIVQLALRLADHLDSALHS